MSEQFTSTLYDSTFIPTELSNYFDVSTTPKPKHSKQPKEPKVPQLTVFPGPKEPKGTDITPLPVIPKPKGAQSINYNNIYWSSDEITVTSIQSASILVCIIPVFIFIYLYIKRDKRVRNKGKSLKTFFTFLIICCICFALTSLLALLNSIFLEANIYDYDKNSTHYNLIQIPLQIVWVIARTLMYIFYIIRLHFVYKDSMYQYSDTFISCLLIIISICGIFQVLTKIFGHLEIVNVFQGHYISIIMLFKDIITSIFLIYLFVNVLLKLVTVQSKNSVKEHFKNYSGSIDEENITVKKERKSSSFDSFHAKYSTVSTVIDESHNRSEDMLNTITKITILSCVALISTIIVLIVENILSKTIKTNVLFDHILLALFSVDCGINSICLYLSFVFAKQHYKCLCGCMNRNCIKYCLWISNVKVVCSKDIQKEIDDISLGSKVPMYKIVPNSHKHKVPNTWAASDIQSEKRESVQFAITLNLSNKTHIQMNSESNATKCNSVELEMDEINLPTDKKDNKEINLQTECISR
eukprot:117698_1